MRKNKTKFESGRYNGMTDEEIEADWKGISERASTEGTKIHRQIELYLNKVSFQRASSKEFQFFIEFYNETIVAENLVVWRTELVVYSEKLAIAGSIDLILYDPATDEYIICDWKRSSKIETFNRFQFLKPPLAHLSDCNTVTYSLQLNVYKYILETEFGMKIRKNEGLKLIFLHPNQKTHIVFHAPDYQEEVQQMFNHRDEQGLQCFRHEKICKKTSPSASQPPPPPPKCLEIANKHVPFVRLDDDETETYSSAAKRCKTEIN